MDLAEALDRVALAQRRAEEVARDLLGRSLDEFALAVARDLGVSYVAMLRSKEGVLATMLAAPPGPTPCPGTLADGTACGKPSRHGWCAMHASQRGVREAKRRRAEAYRDELRATEAPRFGGYAADDRGVVVALGTPRPRFFLV